MNFKPMPEIIKISVLFLSLLLFGSAAVGAQAKGKKKKEGSASKVQNSDTQPEDTQKSPAQEAQISEEQTTVPEQPSSPPSSDQTSAPVSPSSPPSSSSASPPPSSPSSAISSSTSTTVSLTKIIDAIKKLKDEISNSEKRMDEIVGIVLSSTETKGSRIILSHKNEMSQDFVLVDATFSLDGAPIFKKEDVDGILKDQETLIYDGAILPGQHTLSVSLVYRGQGFGILSYISKYKFKVKSKHQFEVKQGKGLELKVVCFEKGDINTKIEDRPAIKYIERKVEIE